MGDLFITGTAKIKFLLPPIAVQLIYPKPFVLFRRGIRYNWVSFQYKGLYPRTGNLKRILREDKLIKESVRKHNRNIFMQIVQIIAKLVTDLFKPVLVSVKR